MFKTVRVSNGYFEVYWNERKTAYVIFNGNLGCSGRGSNFYGISTPNRKDPVWLGTLQKAKKHCEKWVTEAAEAGSLIWFEENHV